MTPSTWSEEAAARLRAYLQRPGYPRSGGVSAPSNAADRAKPGG